MTVPAEVSSFHPIGLGIEVRVAVVAGCAGSSVPESLLTLHVPRRMCSGIGPANTIGIKVTSDTGRIRPLDIVAAHAALDVPPGYRGMAAAARSPPLRDKSSPAMPDGPERWSRPTLPRHMALRTELLYDMTVVTVRRSIPCIDTVREPVVEIVDHRQRHLVW